MARHQREEKRNYGFSASLYSLIDTFVIKRNGGGGGGATRRDQKKRDHSRTLLQEMIPLQPSLRIIVPRRVKIATHMRLSHAVHVKIARHKVARF